PTSTSPVATRTSGLVPVAWSVLITVIVVPAIAQTGTVDDVVAAHIGEVSVSIVVFPPIVTAVVGRAARHSCSNPVPKHFGSDGVSMVTSPVGPSSPPSVTSTGVARWHPASTTSNATRAPIEARLAPGLRRGQRPLTLVVAPVPVAALPIA